MSMQNKSQPEKTPTFDKPIDIKPGQYAKFDGKKLTIFQDGKVVASWNAVSGRPNYQSSEYQNLKSTGPIPAGTYIARQSELQYCLLGFYIKDILNTNVFLFLTKCLTNKKYCLYLCQVKQKKDTT